MHDVTFSYESSENDQKTDSIFRVLEAMCNYRAVVVHDDRVDVKYLLTLKPQHFDTGDSWHDLCAYTIVFVMLAPRCVQYIERVGLSEDLRKPPERRLRELWDEFNRWLTVWRVDL